VERYRLCGWFALHCISFFGIVELEAALIEMECDDADERDVSGYMPLAWAAHNGHAAVMEILLRREEVDSDKPDDFGEISLSHAAWFGREGVVKILLMREEVNLDWPSNDG